MRIYGFQTYLNSGNVFFSSACKYQQQINNKDGNYYQESNWNVGARNET